MPYDVWVDENGLYPPACRCGHPWVGHHDNPAHTCVQCDCSGYKSDT
jgi:hypothetical protein